MKFFFSGNQIEVVYCYICPGILFDEQVNFKMCEQVLADAARRAFGEMMHR